MWGVYEKCHVCDQYTLLAQCVCTNCVTTCSFLLLSAVTTNSDTSVRPTVTVLHVFITCPQGSTIFMTGCEVTATLNTVLLNIFFLRILKKYNSFTLLVICYFIKPRALIIWYSDHPYMFDIFNTIFFFLFSTWNCFFINRRQRTCPPISRN